MSNLIALLDQVQSLCATASHTLEESFRFRVEGDSLSAEQVKAIEAIFTSCAKLNVSAPTLMLDGESADIAELTFSHGENWRLIISKTGLASQLKMRPDEQTCLFFSVEGFDIWSQQLTPFHPQSELDPDFSRPLTVRVHGLPHGFGGPSLWVLPVDAPEPLVPAVSNLPDDEAVHKLVHLISPDQTLRVSPRSWALNWGDLTGVQAREWLRLSCLVLGACLVSELKSSDAALRVTIRGAKSHTVGLWQSHADLQWKPLQDSLMVAVEWIYAERSETRLKLLMDRLSIDIDPAECWLSSLHRHLRSALKQAQDSYAFVILDRKDAYFKEMREVMKDMKSQADLYAAKVRELVSSLTRDILGVLVFAGFSFIGKFDQRNLRELLGSGELSLLLKFLAGYLFLSCVLQLATHWRDADLAFDESSRWLGILRNYTSQSDSAEKFIEPLKKRRDTLCVAMAVSAGLYCLLVLAVWNLPFIVQLLLAQ